VQRTRLRTSALVLLAFFAIGAIAFAASETARFVVCSTVGALIYGFPSESDQAETQMIRAEILTVHHFSHNSLSQPEQPPVFSNPGSKMLFRLPSVIQVYDVQDRTEQDKIAAALRDLAIQKKLKPFKLCFYDHENWVVDGSTGGRGPETQLRCLRITADRVDNVAGQKVITYPTP
jgi:hypothetical protein